MLTIAYVTARREPHFQWFFDGLRSPPQTVPIGSMSAYRIVIIDLYHGQRTDRQLAEMRYHNDIWHVPPKPTVWQGQHRLTSVDYFAAAGARNTALCLAQDGWLAYVDDCSVLMPGWLDHVMEATKRDGIITVGSYRKVRNLKVESGNVISFIDDPLGMDIRNRFSKESIIPCDGGWLYGSSVIPVEALLTINGWDENCDGMGYEDVVTGRLLANSGRNFVYDPGMMVYECQECHESPDVLKRIDKGISPNDKSHAILASTRMRKLASNYFGEEGIRGLRKRVLNGEPFPISNIPAHDWFDKQPLSEM